MKLAIVIPAFNEGAVISKVLQSLPKNIEGISAIETIVVNDGSFDDTSKKVKRAWLITHPLNRGAGAATKTGIEFAKKLNSDIVVTFDADGQHNPNDIKKIILPILSKKADLVIGSRLKKKQKMPPDRYLINWGANVVTLFLFGVLSTDTQSGLRAFSKKAAELISIRSDRMEFSSEILLEAKKHNLKKVEVPTSAIYTGYTRAKGQKNLNAIPIFIKFMVKLLR